jgi:hypothetical protein
MHKLSAAVMMILGLWIHPAHAVQLPEFNVTNDYDSSKTYVVGFNLDASNLIQSIYIEDAKQKIQQFSLSKLNQFTTIYSTMGMNLVQLRIVHMDSAQSGIIELKLLKTFFPSSYFSVQFRVEFDSATQQYKIIDTRSGIAVKTANVIVHMSGPIPTGIDQVETR